MELFELLSSATLEALPRHREAFRAAKPFRFAVLDDFFREDVARWLVEDFPPFRRDKALNEMGRVGLKCVFTDLSAVSPRYARVAKGLSSRAFRDWFSALTGIGNLLHDDEMYGGGTHENLEGAELDPHVDFNFDERLGWHRRLNLLVFLNPEWEASWGGNVELHSNPRDPARDEARLFAPILNRCVVFETNEVSWHGFDRIVLPPDKKHLSRRSLTLYLYTADRPAEEIVPSHATFYVPRPIPKGLRPGEPLAREDFEDLVRGVTKRDAFLHYYQRRELEDSARYQRLLAYHEAVVASARLPLQGYVVQEGPATGWYPDGWIAGECRFAVRARRPLASLRIEALAPGELPYPVEVGLAGPGARETVVLEGPGPCTLSLPLSEPAGRTSRYALSASATTSDESDERERSLHLVEVVFEHRS